MTIPSPVTKGVRTRQAIMEAAYKLFLEQGYAATSMRQVADHAGIALGSIYNHFPSKEAIFRELILVRHPYRTVLPIILNTQTDDPEFFIRSAARTMVEGLGRNPEFIKLMLIEIVEFNGRNMTAIIEQVLPQVLPFIQKFDSQDGVLRKLPPFVFFRAFIGLFFSYFITELMFSGVSSPLVQKNNLDHFVEIFLHGVLTDKEPA